MLLPVDFLKSRRILHEFEIHLTIPRREQEGVSRFKFLINRLIKPLQEFGPSLPVLGAPFTV